MVIDAIGAGGQGIKERMTMERLPQVPVIDPLPPAPGVENQPGPDAGATGGDRRGQRHGAGGVSGAAPAASRQRVREEVEKAGIELNKMMERLNQRLSFRLHEESERVMVQVVDIKTHEVVREMPPEDFLEAIAKMRKTIGLLFDDWF